MKQYQVIMPFAGAISVQVEANSEQEAQEKFYQKVEDINLIDWKALQKVDGDIVECDYYPIMHQGNVKYYGQGRVEIDLMHDDEDEEPEIDE